MPFFLQIVCLLFWLVGCYQGREKLLLCAQAPTSLYSASPLKKGALAAQALVKKPSPQAATSIGSSPSLSKPHSLAKGTDWTRKPLIIIDAGHGGEDFGTYSRTQPRFHEKHLTLQTAKLVEKKLSRLGFRTHLTRKEDLFLPLEARVALAEKKKAGLFVSIHYNSAPNDQAQGIEIFYCKENALRRSRYSKILADFILKRMIEQTGARSRGVKMGNFLVIRETKMPAVLIEAGFLTNSDELKSIKSAAYQEKLAEGIVQGISKYLSLF